MRHYAFIILLVLSPNVFSSQCFLVSDLTTRWQDTLSKIYINIGDRRDIEYEILIEGGGAVIAPGEFDCFVDRTNENYGAIYIDCGKNLIIEEYSGSDPLKQKHKSIYSKITGTVDESWTFNLNNGVVILNVYKGSGKSYEGIYEASC